jgi:hypothetical protein
VNWLFDKSIFDSGTQFEGIFDKDVFDPNIFDFETVLKLFDPGTVSNIVYIPGFELQTETGQIQVNGRQIAPKIIDGGRLPRRKLKAKSVRVEVALPISGFVVNMKFGIVKAEAKVNTEEEELLAILLEL